MQDVPLSATWTQVAEVPARGLIGYVVDNPLLLLTALELFVALFFDPDKDTQFIVMTAIWACCTVVAYVQGGRRRRPKKIEDKDELLLDNPEDPHSALVHVRVLQDGALTGSDEGVVTISEDALFFSGHKTAFCIGPQDLAVKTLLPPAHTDLASNSGLILRLRHSACKLDVAMEPLDSNIQAARLSLVRRTFGDVVKAGGVTTLARIYPPLLPSGPARLVLSNSWRIAGVVLALQGVWGMSASFVWRPLCLLVMGTLTLLALLRPKFLVRSR